MEMDVGTSIELGDNSILLVGCEQSIADKLHHCITILFLSQTTMMCQDVGDDNLEVQRGRCVVRGLFDADNRAISVVEERGRWSVG